MSQLVGDHRKATVTQQPLVTATICIIASLSGRHLSAFITFGNIHLVSC